MILQKLKNLFGQLLPTGRVFKIPFDGDLAKLRDALSESEKRLYDDAKSIFNSALPDNDDFAEDDATAWEFRLGLVSNDNVDLEDRKLGIKRKMNHPGGIPARQHYLFLQRELRNAGFDVYVHENPDRLSPFDVIGGTILYQHGDFQHGDSQHGGLTGDFVINKMTSEIGAAIGTNYSTVFFIGGENLGDFANVDVNRERELRQMILRIKPLNQIAYLLINYT
jgi:hypothetical protein